MGIDVQFLFVDVCEQMQLAKLFELNGFRFWKALV